VPVPAGTYSVQAFLSLSPGKYIAGKVR